MAYGLDSKYTIVYLNKARVKALLEPCINQNVIEEHSDIDDAKKLF